MPFDTKNDQFTQTGSGQSRLFSMFFRSVLSWVCLGKCSAVIVKAWTKIRRPFWGHLLPVDELCNHVFRMTVHLSPAAKSTGKRSFWAIYIYKRSFYQDRLRTNIGKTQKKTVLQSWSWKNRPAFLFWTISSSSLRLSRDKSVFPMSVPSLSW